MSSERSPKRADSPARRSTILHPRTGTANQVRKHPGWRSAVLLLVPCLAPALEVMAANPVGIPHVERLLVLSAVTALAGYVSCWALMARGGSERTTVQATFVILGAFWFGGTLLRRFGTVPGWALVLVLSVLSIAVVIVFRDTALPGSLILTACVFLLTSPLIEGVQSFLGYGVSTVGEPADLESEMATTPDIWLIVFDEHPGRQALDLDFSPAESRELEAAIAATGYVMPESVWTSYWATDWAVPSLLNMGYPTEVADDQDATIQDLYRIVSGQNRLLDLLESNGYESFMVEAGWSGSSCGPAYDHCVASPWLDEAMYLMVVESLIGKPVFENYGYAFTVGTQSSMSWLLDHADELSDDGTPSFVFAHLMAPHPPFFLDGECSTVVSPSRFGLTFDHADVPSSERESYLVDTMECLSEFMVDFAGAVGDDDIVIFISDHGTDRRGQLVTDPSEWSIDASTERMNALLAVSPSTCAMGERVVLPNILRRALSCLTANGIADVEERMFVGEDMELADASVSVLLERGSGPTAALGEFSDRPAE